MLISKTANSVQMRVALVRQAVQKELTELGYTCDANLVINGHSLPVHIDETSPRWRRRATPTESIVAVSIGYRSKKPTWTIIRLREAKKGFETQRIVKAIVKFYKEHVGELQKIQAAREFKIRINRAVDIANKSLNSVHARCDCYGYTDNSNRVQFTLPSNATPEQITSIAECIQHEIEVYGEADEATTTVSDG